MGETTEAGKALLLTRPRVQSERFVTELGLDALAVISPLSEMEATGVAVPTDGALLITSGRAVEAAGAALAGRLAYCVGDKTAALAQAAGANPVSAGGDAQALLALVLNERPKRLTHLRGDHGRGDLAARLSATGVPTDEVQVYKTRDLPLSAEARQLLDGSGLVLAPVFSPRSARRLAGEAGAALPRLAVVAISAAAAEPVKDAARVIIAEAPEAHAMRAAVRRLWDDLPYPKRGATVAGVGGRLPPKPERGS